MTKKYFCYIEECGHGCLNEFGDGWNEPVMDEWLCEVENDLDNEAEYTDDDNDEMCPLFKEVRRDW